MKGDPERRSAVPVQDAYAQPVTTLIGRLDAQAAAHLAGQLLAGDSRDLNRVWRHTIVQLLADYDGARRQDEPAEDLFAGVPVRTADSRVDAALAALAEHLARRDGWLPPTWAYDSARYAEPWWFVAGVVSLEATAVQQSPLAFRKRGVFLTEAGLTRV